MSTIAQHRDDTSSLVQNTLYNNDIKKMSSLYSKWNVTFSLYFS